MRGNKPLIILSLTMLPLFCHAAELIQIKGSGSSVVISQMFAHEIATTPEAAGYRFEIDPHSTKHDGGVKHSDDHLFGRTGRPLNEEEKASGKSEILLARIPLTFVAGDGAGVKNLSIGQVLNIFSRKITNWKEVGGADMPIALIGREPTETGFSEMKAQYYALNDVNFDRVLKKDDEVVDYIESADGKYAISFGSLANFKAQNILDVTGFNTGVNVGLVYDNKNKDHPLVQAAIRIAEGMEWRTALIRSGFLPPRVKARAFKEPG